MIRTSGNSKNASIVLAVTLITLVTIPTVLTSSFAQSNFRINVDSIINQIPKQSPLPTSQTNINETDSLDVANSYTSNLSAPVSTLPISLETLKPATIKQIDRPHLFFSFYNPNQEQIADSYINPQISPSLLNTLDFATYTYGSYPVQQIDPSQFFFLFPDNTNQGQLAGSDAITLEAYTIQKMDFDAAFVAPKTGALGFDEMVIFAASDASTYKGIEFGVRLDLSDGYIYGYIQEPNGNYGDVNFQMLKLMPNDGMLHHYTLVMLGSEVSFYIDGINYGYLNFLGNTDYSSLTFYILAVVHRFTDNWDSVGDNMTAENFFLNQP